MEGHEWWEQLSPEQQEHMRKKWTIGTDATIKEMFEGQGWTVTATDHEQDNPYHGSITASKGDIDSVTYYFEYHTLADIEWQFKRIAGEER